MRLPVSPFLTAPAEAARFLSAWHVRGPEGPEPLGDRISSWDPLTVLILTADLDVDANLIHSAAHLGSHGRLAVVVSAASSTTRLRGPVWRADIDDQKGKRFEIEIALGGMELGGRLDLITRIVVGTPDPLDVLSPDLPGAILWEHIQGVILEGEAEQFPTEAADLSAQPYCMPHAAWFLEVQSSDLDTLAAGAVRLVVNDAHPLMKPYSMGIRLPMP